MGRWKMGPQGGYWDGQDTGPDQMQPTPEMMQAAGQGGAPAGPVPAPGQPAPVPGMENGGVTGNTGGPIDLTPGEGGQWGMGGQMGDLRSILEALRGRFGGQINPRIGGLLGPAAGGSGQYGPGSAVPIAPQKSLAGMLGQPKPGGMNIGTLGGALGGAMKRLF